MPRRRSPVLPPRRRRAGWRYAGVVTGLPALRLRTFYFAMTTLGFATIVTQVALAWQSVTGGGIGLPGPELPAPFDTAGGFYVFCLAAAAFCTWLTSNIAHSRYGRALVAVRDADVAAKAGHRQVAAARRRFSFRGRRRPSPAGCSQRCKPISRPDAFTFDLSVLFFIADPDRRAWIDPRAAHRHHRAHPAAGIRRAARSMVDFPLCRAAPGGRPRGTRRHRGFARCGTAASLPANRTIAPQPELLRLICSASAGTPPNRCTASCSASAACAPSMASASWQVRARFMGLSARTAAAKRRRSTSSPAIYPQDAGTIRLAGNALPPGASERAGIGIARTFQTPRIVGRGLCAA